MNHKTISTNNKSKSGTVQKNGNENKMNSNIRLPVTKKSAKKEKYATKHYDSASTQASTDNEPVPAACDSPIALPEPVVVETITAPVLSRALKAKANKYAKALNTLYKRQEKIRIAQYKQEKKHFMSLVDGLKKMLREPVSFYKVKVMRKSWITPAIRAYIKQQATIKTNVIIAAYKQFQTQFKTKCNMLAIEYQYPTLKPVDIYMPLVSKVNTIAVSRYALSLALNTPLLAIEWPSDFTYEMYVKLFEELNELVLAGCEEGNSSALVVCGQERKQAMKTANKSLQLNKKRLVDIERHITQKLKGKRLSTQSGALRQYTVPITGQVLDMFIMSIQRIFKHDLQFEDMDDFQVGQRWGLTNQDVADVIVTRGRYLDRSVEYIANMIKKTFSKVSNVKLTAQVQFYDDVTGQDVTFTDEHNNMYELINAIVKSHRHYGRTMEQFKRAMTTLEFIILVGTEKNTSITRGQLYKEAVKSNWVCVNPNTKKLCVSFCAVVYEHYQDTCNAAEITYDGLQQKAQRFANKHEVSDGCNDTQVKQLAEKYDWQIMYGLGTNVESLNTIKPIFVIHEGHCMLLLPPNERSQTIYSIIRAYTEEKSAPMKAWEPRELINHLATYDFEFVKKMNGEIGTEVPYMFGIYTLIKDVPVYLPYKSDIADSIYKQFVDNLHYLASEVNELYQDQAFDQIADKCKKCLKKGKLCKKHIDDRTDVIINLAGFNSFKADFPLVVRALLSDRRFKMTLSLESGMAEIAQVFNVQFTDSACNILIYFTDAMNMVPAMCKSLDKFCEAMGVQQKEHVDHKKVQQAYERGQLAQEIVAQNIEHYQFIDCKCLYDACIVMYKQYSDMLGYDVFNSGTLTTSTMSQRAYFLKGGRFYKDSVEQNEEIDADMQTDIQRAIVSKLMYAETTEQQDRNSKGFSGGITDCSVIGITNANICYDVNNAHPASMVEKELPTGEEKRVIFNDQHLYDGYAIKAGMYTIYIVDSPDIQFPAIQVQQDGKLVSARLQNTRVRVTSEVLQLAYKDGVKFYIEEADVCDETGMPFKDYIYYMQGNRRLFKTMMGAYEKLSKEDDESKHQAIKDKALAQLPIICKEMGIQCNETFVDDKSRYAELARTYSLKQETCKLCLNGLFGKFGFGSIRTVSNQICGDENELMRKFYSGELKSFKQIDDRHVLWSGHSKANTPRTNYMIASFITARSRLRLIKAARELSAIGCIVTYMDTDSVHISTNGPNYNAEALKQWNVENCHDNALGKWKIEETPELAIHLGAKIYGTVNDGHEDLKMKGVLAWIIKDDKKSSDRRADAGVQQIKFQDMVDLWNCRTKFGQKQKEIEFTIDRVQRNKQLLTSNADHIKVVRQMTTNVSCTYDKKDTLYNYQYKNGYTEAHQEMQTRYGQNDGQDFKVCWPRTINSRHQRAVYIKESDQQDDENETTITDQEYEVMILQPRAPGRYIQGEALCYAKKDELERAFTYNWKEGDKQVSCEEIASKWAVFKDSDDGFKIYVVMPKAGCDYSQIISEFLAKRNKNNNIHQVFGAVQCLAVDVDLKVGRDGEAMQSELESYNMDIQTVVDIIRNRFNLDESVQVHVVDRSGQRNDMYKYSYHIWASVNVEKTHLKATLVEIKKQFKNTLCEFIDIQPYRNFGSLRYTAPLYSEYYFMPTKTCIQSSATARTQQMKARATRVQESTLTGSAHAEYAKRAEQWLVDNNMQDQWSVRSFNTTKTCVYANFTKRVKCGLHCIICDKVHKNEQFLQLKMTAKTIKQLCRKQVGQKKTK